MGLVTFITGILLLLIVSGSIYLIKKHKADIRLIGIMDLILILILACFFFSGIQYRRLKRYGFSYKIEEAKFPTWKIITFFSRDSDGKKVRGPLVAGDRLKLKCRDIDDDGVPEFIIQSNVWEAYRTILKVDLESGSYHVHYTKGLKVDFPPEDYHYSIIHEQ
jgi:hypothetical protein